MGLFDDIVQGIASVVDPLIEQGEEALENIAKQMGFDVSIDLPDTEDIANWIVGLSSEGSSIGAGPMRWQKFMVGDVVFEVVEGEVIQESNELPQHPVEDRRMFQDHAWRMPVRFSVDGILIGYPVSTMRHKKSLAALRALRDKAQPVTVVTDFPPGRFENMVIKELEASHEYPDRNAYKISLEMEQIMFVAVPGTGGFDPAGTTDTATGTPNEGAPTSSGLRGEGAETAPPNDLLGGLMDTLGKLWSDFAQSDIGKTLIDLGTSLIEDWVPGAGLAMDALSGNLDAMSLLEGAASLIPGVGPMVSQALDLAKAAAPYVQAAVTAFTEGGAEGAARALASAALGQLAANMPGLSGICGFAQGVISQ